MDSPSEIAVNCSACGILFYVAPHESWKRECFPCYAKEKTAKVCKCGNSFTVKAGEEKWKNQCLACYKRNNNDKSRVICSCGKVYYVNSGEAQWKTSCMACFKALKNQ